MVAMMRWGVPVQGWRKGPWTPEEDKLLSEHVKLHGEGRWSSVSKCAGLNRSGKSCRLRWVNYLRPGLKRGQITPQEEGIIIELHALWGNKWSTIARYLPGRTDNEIKNYWRTHFKKKEKSCNKKQEKRKANQILNRKQQQEEQQLGADMNGVLNNSSDDDDDKMIHSNILEAKNQNQEMSFMYPTNLEEQCLFPAAEVSSWADFMVDDGLLWSGLWNLDDDHEHHQYDHTSNGSKIAKQNQASAFSFGVGNLSNNNYTNGGYIF